MFAGIPRYIPRYVTRHVSYLQPEEMAINKVWGVFI